MVRKQNYKISCIFFWHETKWTQGQERKFLFLSPTAYVWSISLYACVRVYFSPPLVRRFFWYLITISWKHTGSCDSLTYTILSFSNKRPWKMSAEENPDRLMVKHKALRYLISANLSASSLSVLCLPPREQPSTHTSMLSVVLI